MNRTGKSILFFGTLLVALLSGCGKGYTRQDYKAAIYSAYQSTLAREGISINGLIFVMRYDNDPVANAVALFYAKDSEDSFSFVKTKFPTPQALRDWMLDYIRKYISVVKERE